MLKNPSVIRILVYNAILGLATLLGTQVAPDLAIQYADAIMSLVPLFSLIGSAVIHLFTKKQATAGDTGSSGTGSGTASLIGLLILLPALFAMSACASFSAQTTKQKWFAYENDFQIAQGAIIDYLHSGHVNPDVKMALQELEATAFAAVTAANDSVQAGNSATVPALTAAAIEAVGALKDYMVKYSLWPSLLSDMRLPPPRAPPWTTRQRHDLVMEG